MNLNYNPWKIKFSSSSSLSVSVSVCLSLSVACRLAGTDCKNRQMPEIFFCNEYLSSEFCLLLSESINASSLLPVITGYNESRTLHKGDNVSLLCDVPNSCLPSPEVVFACGSRYSNKTSRRENVTSLEIQIDEIEASDDGLTCVCKVAWKLPETMYNNARISLETSFVLSVQGIAHKINLPLTFMIYIS